MSVKRSRFISDHYPNTYMEQFCRSIHPDLELGPVCVQWFRQATNHCTNLIANAKAPSMYFWIRMKNFIFPESKTELMSPKIPIRIHPKHLSLEDCQSLFVDIVHDYVLRAPRYASESTTNAILWQVLYSLVGIGFLACILLGAIFVFKKHGFSKVKKPVDEHDPFQPWKCLRATAKRSLNIAKYELRKLKVDPLLQPEELFAPDGSAILAVKLYSKYDFMNSVISSSVENTSRLYRVTKNLDESEFRTETVEKALRFLENCPRKLRLIILFQDEPEKVYRQLEDVNVRSKENNMSPKKLSQIPHKFKNPLRNLPDSRLSNLQRTSGVETLCSSSPRFDEPLSKQSPYKVGDAGSPRPNQCSQRGSLGINPRTPLSGSPKKKLTSPRLGNPAASSHRPRNCPVHTDTNLLKK